jgi:exodeoxyribonuclease-5
LSAWSPKQERALKEVARWFGTGHPAQQVFRLFGYAGTGKTTLAKHFASAIEGTVLFAAYTGKAAHVLQQKGCPSATTIHKLIYQPKDRSKARLRELEVALARLMEEKNPDPTRKARYEELKHSIEHEKKQLSRPLWALQEESQLKGAALLIVDECSMVDKAMGEDICSYDVPVLVLGDPAQLPPVFGGGYFTNCKPDVMLTEIHRQEADNPIIEMSRIVREGGILELGTYGNSRIIGRGKMDPEEALRHDQILVGRNATRRGVNARVRSLHGRADPMPVTGDRLVCLKNNHQHGLLNGGLWIVDALREYDAVDACRAVLDIRAEDNDQHKLEEINAFTQPFLGQEVPFWEKKEAEEFDYGYGLTVHKFQGSQARKILLIDEWFKKESRKEWLYTAITRASEEITIVRQT